MINIEENQLFIKALTKNLKKKNSIISNPKKIRK